MCSWDRRRPEGLELGEQSWDRIGETWWVLGPHDAAMPKEGVGFYSQPSTEPLEDFD